LIPLIYDEISLNRGIGCVKKNGKFGLIDNNGKELLKIQYDEIRFDFYLPLDEIYFPVKRKGRWGFFKVKIPLPAPPPPFP
jgi:hypothetical protein